MNLQFSMPGGSEWILIIFFLAFFITAPILAIYYYKKAYSLKKELDQTNREKAQLLAKLLDKS